MKSKELIEKQLNRIPEGMVFDYSDLALPTDYSLSAAQTFSRMVRAGQLRKVGKGRFYKPKFTRLGEVPPMIEGLTRDLVYKDGERIGYITGVQAFSQMGLTTQVSSNILIASNTYRRPLKRAGYGISYTKQENIISEASISLLRILDSLKFIKQIPATTPGEVVAKLRGLLQTLTNEEVLAFEDYAFKYPASARALAGAIMESALGIDSKLKATLNPFTVYRIGITDNVLPNKANWRII